jgi:hypothetical protein
MRSPSDPASNTDNTKLFDVIPQVAEVRNYLKERWHPPASFTETLQYSLILDTDGSIQRILPLGTGAVKYLSRAGMPIPGEPFVSGLKGGSNPIIRVVLSPDGNVETFLEETVELKK